MNGVVAGFFSFKSEAFCCLLITAGVTGLSGSKHPFSVTLSLFRG